MTIKEFAKRYSVSLRTIQRNVKSFDKNLPSKPDTIISNDEALYTYLLEKRGVEADILTNEETGKKYGSLVNTRLTDFRKEIGDEFPRHPFGDIGKGAHVPPTEEETEAAKKEWIKAINTEVETPKLYPHTKTDGHIKEGSEMSKSEILGTYSYDGSSGDGEASKTKINVDLSINDTPISKEENRFFNKDGSTKKVEKEEPKDAEKTEVQKALNNTSLMWFILINLLLADSVAFYVITKVTFSTVLPGSEWAFAWLGIVSGLASIVSYSRIKEDKTAEGYKYTFAVLQVVVFLSAAFSWWTLGKVTLTIMITIGFTGVITSIRHDK